MSADLGTRSLPSVAVVLLNWRRWPDTVRCWESLRRLDYPALDIVIVDNDSGDDSESRLRERCAGSLVIQSGANLGFSGGCNRGIREALARGAELVWLLNNDATATPDALRRMVATALSDDAIGCVGAVLYSTDGTERIRTWGGGRINFLTGRSIQLTAPATPDYISGASMLIPRRVIERVGLLDEENFFMYWEDADYCFRIRAAGLKLAVAADAKVHHAEFGSLGRSNPLLDRYFTESAITFFRRHARVPVIPIAVSVCGRLVKRVLQLRFNSAWEIVRAVARSL
jgi:GT2 family glycosyltransferase